MSADKIAPLPEPRVTLDDLRHQAEAVKSKALAEAKSSVDAVIGPDEKRTLIMVAGLVLVAASLAFFLGSRSGRTMVADRVPGE
ncbi:MAG TPA: hypothetical protein VLA05_03215 [Coriobacteriia bacterium]|nr:hypothetical protein [Coriobacteriia bacterium]